MWRADRCDYMMCAGISGANQEEADKLELVGLIPGHAYCVIGVSEVKDIKGNIT